MVTDLGKGTLIADSEEEAIWWKEAEEGKAQIKIIQASIRGAKSDLKISAREVHQKFIRGAKANIKQKKISLKVQRAFLKFCESKINFPK